MYLLLYDIEGRRDPHGIRIRLVRALRKANAFQLQKSSWILEEFDKDLISLIEEFRRAGGCIKIIEWIPRTINEVLGRDEINRVAIAPISIEPLLEKWHEKIALALKENGIESIVVPVGRKIRELLLDEECEKRISRVLDEIALMDIDGIIALNCGRSAKSGIVFMSQILSNTKILKNMMALPLIHVERLGRDDGVIIAWSSKNKRLIDIIKGVTSLDVIKPTPELKGVLKSEDKEIRKIHYVEPGDKIIANEIYIGKCLSNQVYIVAKDGKIIEILGGKIFKRNIEKLKFNSLSELIIKTMKD
ncbi:MAG: DUF2117 domain-containing protein [Candidatus Methanomethyliaceae archaeon]|nr:DUF2117 domain-containing protein [Candidatus Methanomethyliaceae archaeon]MDW7971102.1 DUF2117 domain-containing protein [Nitrososphaerota archaeon]